MASLESSVMLTKRLAEQWAASGISEGDVVLLHSSSSRTLSTFRAHSESLSLANLLDSFLTAIGSTGTLLLPTFNFGFCEGQGFSYVTTPSKMGALTEFARLDPRFRRTTHPVYSFAVSGRHTEAFVALTNVSALSDDGPFGLLRRLRGKIAVLDLDDQNSMTMYHHIEEVMNVDYRYLKPFNGSYTDERQVTTNRTYSLFVWDEAKGVRTDVNRAGELLWARGLYQGHRPGLESGLRVIDAQLMFLAIAEVIATGRAKDFLFSTEKL